MASPTLQFKRGAFVNLPGLRAGEPGFTTDKYDLFVGLSSNTETNQFFGSARYWTRENGIDAAAEFKFVDKNGTNGVSLRAPATTSVPVTYTLPQGGGTQGHFLRLGSAGVLEWATVTDGASFDGATLSNTTFTGISTFNGLIDATQGIDVTGHTELDDLNVSGVGTIATADINGGTIDGTIIGGSSPAAASFTELDYDNSTTTGISTVGSLYIGTDKVLSVEGTDLTLSNIDAIDAVTKATLEATLALDPNDFDSLNVSGIGTIGGLLDAKGGLNVDGHSELDTVNVSVAATFASATVSDLTAGRVVLAGTGGELEDSANLTFGAGGLIVGAGGINVTGVSTFSQTLNSTSLIAATNLTASGISTLNTLEVSENTTLGNGSGDQLTVNATSTFNSPATFLDTLTGTISTATRSTQVDTTETGDNVEYYPTFVAISTSTQSQTVRTDAGISYNPDSNTLTVPNIKTENLKHSNGTQSIAIDAVGNVSFASTVTIEGDLQVLGSTTTVNTETLLVKDPVIELGLIDDNGALVPPAGTTATDLGLVFHYYDDVEDSAATSAFYWDHDTNRFALASTLTAYPSTTGQIEADAFAALELSSLYISDCAGSAQQVFGCQDGEVTLMNTVIDGGTF